MNAVIDERKADRELVAMIHSHNEMKRERSARFNDKFAVDEMSGTFVMKADAMPRRFDNSSQRTAPGMMLREDASTIGAFGNGEWAEEKRTLSQAHTLKAQGFKMPSKFCNRLRADTLEIWVRRHKEVFA